MRPAAGHAPFQLPVSVLAYPPSCTLLSLPWPGHRRKNIFRHTHATLHYFIHNNKASCLITITVQHTKKAGMRYPIAGHRIPACEAHSIREKTGTTSNKSRASARVRPCYDMVQLLLVVIIRASLADALWRNVTLPMRNSTTLRLL